MGNINRILYDYESGTAGYCVTVRRPVLAEASTVVLCLAFAEDNTAPESVTAGPMLRVVADLQMALLYLHVLLLSHACSIWPQ